jgi:TRAP-type C4-dicarboxylate transport system permease small subunit
VTVRAAGAALERMVTAFERALIVLLLAVMAGSVFLDALHRLFAADEGRLERLLLTLLPAAAAGAVRQFLAPVALLLATLALAYGAVRSRQASVAGEGPATPAKSRRRLLLEALGLTALLALGTRALVWLLPNGLVWSQQMALCFMLWVALAGASLGAREHAHITFELAGALWPRPLRRPVEGLARLIAAGFALFLALLAALHAREHYLEWQSSGGAAGLFEAFRVPRFLIFGFLPLPLCSLALRFLAYGVRAPEGRS